MNRRGTMSIFVGATVPIVLVLGLLAVDATRIWLHRARVQAAVDAAALAAARDMDGGKRDATGAYRHPNAEAVLNADNYGQATAWTSASVAPVSGNANQAQAVAEVKVDSALSTFGFDWAKVPLFGTTKIRATSIAERTSSGLELALVFDTTLSMAEVSGGKAHIVRASEAAHTMLGILYGDKQGQTRREWLEHMYVSIVPFNIAVNIGTANAHMLDPGPAAPNYYDATNKRTFAWSGCVEARQGNFHLTDDGPMVTNAGFRRYYWPSTYNTQLTTAAGKCTGYQDYYDDDKSPKGNNVCQGSNDWTAPLNVVSRNNFLVDANKYVVDELDGVNKTLSFGPNMFCPTLSILPLTMDRKTIEAHLAKLGKVADLPFAFGTMVPPGLQGAWYTLSPQWRRDTATAGPTGWTRVEPVVNDGRPPVPALPLDYGVGNMRKVIVLLSDGDNNWPNARNIIQSVRGTSATYGEESKVVLPDSTRTELFYGAYGLLSTEYTTARRLDISVPNSAQPRTLNHSQLVSDYSNVRNGTYGADARLDVATRQLCTNIKTKNQITIYVIGFGVANNAHRQLLKDCATSADHYLEAATPQQLEDKFKAIAQELVNLRLYR